MQFDQMGIFFNICAGLLLSLEYFIDKERIKIIERGSNSYISRISEYLNNRHSNKRINDKNTILDPLYSMFVYLFIPYLIYTYLTLANYNLNLPYDPIIHVYYDNYLARDTGLTWLTKFLFSFIMFYFLIIFVALEAIRIIVYVLRISPKGVLGSIGIACFIVGNALQLWATFK